MYMTGPSSSATYNKRCGLMLLLLSLSILAFSQKVQHSYSQGEMGNDYNLNDDKSKRRFSFNIIKILERQRSRKWNRSGIKYFQFEDEQAVHAVYASNTGKEKMLLIHGFGANGLLQWYDAARILNADYDVIITDLLGSGTTLMKQDGYTIKDQVEHLKATIDFLGVNEKIIVVGNSYGGLVASHFAHYYPDYVSKLVIYDAPAKHYQLSYANQIAATMGLNNIEQLLIPPTPEVMKQSLKIIYHKVPYIPDFIFEAMFQEPDHVQRAHQKKLLDHLIGFEKYYQVMDYQFKMPIYLIWGEYDLLIPLTTAFALKEEYNIPDERMAIIPNAAHAANMELPKEFCKALRELIK
jgi:pimeloyl-ACP methyl ester carboxylesterase